MTAYVEMLPPDRPIFMLGQPILHLFTNGGPGEDLGDTGTMKTGEFGQSAFIGIADLACAQPMDSLNGLGCCGGSPPGEMSGLDPVSAFNAMNQRCGGIEKEINDLQAWIQKNGATFDATGAKARICGLRMRLRECLGAMKNAVCAARASNPQSAKVLTKVEKAVDKKIQVENTKLALQNMKGR